MALVLTLQLLALSWPLCLTGVTSNGAPEAQGAPHSNAPASSPKHGNWRDIASLLESSSRAPPPRPLAPWAWDPPSHPNIKQPRPLNPVYPFPHPYPKPKPKPKLPTYSVPTISYPKTLPPRPWDPPSHPNIKQPRPWDPVYPFPYPKPKQPPYSVPTISYPKTLPPRPWDPLYPFPYPYPKPKPPTYSVPPTSLPKPPKPSLAAQPAAVVTPGVNVTLTCRAPQPASRFVLTSGEGAPVQYQHPQDPQDRDASPALAHFFLEAVTEAQGGTYRCEYLSPRGWSQPSDALELMVTDLLPRPTLEALPGPPLRLRCTGRGRHLSFALYRAGEAAPLQFRESAQPWADFPLPRAQAAGTYTCYYHTPAAPYVLSPRSAPLLVRPEGSGSVDHTAGNAARLALGGLVLLALAALLGWERRGGGCPGAEAADARPAEPSPPMTATTAPVRARPRPSSGSLVQARVRAPALLFTHRAPGGGRKAARSPRSPRPCHGRSAPAPLPGPAGGRGHEAGSVVNSDRPAGTAQG